jgi:hypothetical protein
MERWEQELSQYNERLSNIENWNPSVSELLKKLPQIPLNYTPSTQGSIAIQLSVFVSSVCISFVYQTIEAFASLWKMGLMTMVSLPTRLTFEIWGANHYALQIIDNMKKSGDFIRASEKTASIILGARSNFELPWGEITSKKSIHIMEFIRSLKDVDPYVEDTYGFLCESCHPSFFGLMYWQMTRPPLQNWENATFRKKAHEMINRTIKAMEQALNGISSDAKRTLDIAIPYIEKDRKLNSDPK